MEFFFRGGKKDDFDSWEMRPHKFVKLSFNGFTSQWVDLGKFLKQFPKALSLSLWFKENKREEKLVESIGGKFL